MLAFPCIFPWTTMVRNTWWEIRFWFFSRYIAISDRDTPHFLLYLDIVSKNIHVTTRDHWSRDHPIGDPWLPISHFGIYPIIMSIGNVMNLGTVGLVEYVIALAAVGPHRLTGFGVSRHPSWVPAIDKAHRAYYSCSRYRGNAWSATCCMVFAMLSRL